MAKVMTTVTNIFAAFRRDLSCISGLPPPDEGVWLIWDARDSKLCPGISLLQRTLTICQYATLMKINGPVYRKISFTIVKVTWLFWLQDMSHWVNRMVFTRICVGGTVCNTSRSGRSAQMVIVGASVFEDGKHGSRNSIFGCSSEMKEPHTAGEMEIRGWMNASSTFERSRLPLYYCKDMFQLNNRINWIRNSIYIGSGSPERQ